MLLVAKNNVVVQFDAGEFLKIGKFEQGQSLLFHSNSIFQDTDSNFRLAEATMARGDFATFAKTVEDGFACIGIENGIPQWLLTDPFGLRRLYYYQAGSTLAVSDDPSRLLQWLAGSDESISVDEDQLTRFFHIGYSDEGRTFLNNVSRSVAGLQIRFDKGNSEDLLHYLTPLESNFDEVIESTMYRATRRSDGIALLFSGGIDSSALLLACKESAPDRDIICISVIPEPAALADVRVKAQLETSIKIAKRLGVRHQYVKANFESKEELTRIAKVQPFDFGITNWWSAFRKVQKDKNYLFICGQNADSLSNFGHTVPLEGAKLSRKMLIMGKRFLVTRQFIESRYKWLLSPILARLFIGSKKYKLARNDSELFSYFFQPEMYRLPIARTGFEMQMNQGVLENPENLLDELFLRNLRRYNDSSVGRLFLTIASLAEQNALLPYCSRDMIRFFRYRLHEASMSEQLHGKYQLRKYVYKRIPKALIRAGYAMEEQTETEKIKIKNEIRREARHIWTSVLPSPLDKLLGERLEAFESASDK